MGARPWNRRIGAIVPSRWVCLLTAAALGAAVAATIGASALGVFLLIVLLGCPIALVVAWFESRTPLPTPIGEAPATQGATLGWLAPWYDGVAAALGLGRAFRERTLAIAALRPGERVIDLGCGTGTLARMAAAQVAPNGRALGIDAARDMVRLAQQVGGIERNAARFRLGAIEQLDMAPASQDVAFVSLVLHCLPADSKRAALREARRVLRPGGRLITVDLDRARGALQRAASRPLRAIPSIRPHLDGRTPALLSEAGFLDVTEAGRWGPWIAFWFARAPEEALV